jgi:hypothetical protein
MKLSCVHFVLKLEWYTGDLGGERSDDSFQDLPPLSKVAEVWARFRKEAGRLRRWANQEKFSPFQ